MATYHLHASVISRATSPRTTCAAAAYVGGMRITCQRDGRTHDYTRRHDVVARGVCLPEGAPGKLVDPSVLWNAVEVDVERGARAQLAREMDIAIPRELDQSARAMLAEDFARSIAESENVPVQWAVHDKRDGNPHLHILAPLRTIDPESGRWRPKSSNVYLVRDGSGNEREATAAQLRKLGARWQKVFRYRGGKKLTQVQAEEAGLHPTRDRTSKTPVQTTRYTSEWSGNWAEDLIDGDGRVRTPKKLNELRRRWQDMANYALERAGSGERIDHRSNRARGIELLPTMHEGPSVTAVERKAEARAKAEGRAYEPVTEIRRRNLLVKAINERIREIMEEIRQIILSRLERARTQQGKRNAQRRVARGTRRPRAKRPYAPQRGRRISPRGGYGR